MNDPSNNKKAQKQNPWLERRTVKEEANNDVMFSVFVKYFSVLMGGLFAIILAKPETTSGVFFLEIIPLRPTIYYYLIIGIMGLLGYETFAMVARRKKSQIEIPLICIVLFGFYAFSGFYLFLTLFARLIGME